MATIETQTSYDYSFVISAGDFKCRRLLGAKIDECVDGALNSFEMGGMSKTVRYILHQVGMSKFASLINSCLLYSLDISGNENGSRLCIYAQGFEATMTMADPRFYTHIRDFCEAVIAGASIPTEPV